MLYIQVLAVILYTVTNPIPLSAQAGLDLEPQNAISSAIVRRFNYFDLELLQEFSASDENVFISPASIKTTLSMILEGAGGKCAQEIGNALRIDDIDQTEIRKQLNSLLFDLNDKTANNELSTANAVFISDKLKILSDYQMKLAKHYKALIKPVDFTNPGKTIEEINEWANNATKGEIPAIIGDNLFEESTIVLANVLYFKGKWSSSFNPKDTQTKCFEVPNYGCKKVQMMQKSDTLNYSLVSYLNAHAVEVPYKDDKFSMVMLIPSAGTNVKILARDLQHAHFETILDSMKPTDIVLEMPKFEIENELNLIDYLRPLKIQEIFGPNANLSGIVSNTNLRIGNIVHKAKIEVDEEGTKAAAATSAIVIPLMGETDLKVAADRPFVFFIFQKESRNIIFEGIVQDPMTSPSPKVPTPVYSAAPTAKPVNSAPKTHAQKPKFIPNMQSRQVPNVDGQRISYPKFQ